MDMMGVLFLGSVVLLLVTCVEMWSNGNKIEALTEQIKDIKRWMKSKDTHEKDLLDELNEKEEECFELRKKLNEMYNKINTN